MLRIPSFSNKLTDLKNGLITREWFRFLEGLWNLTGANSNTVSLTDLQVGGVTPVQEMPYTGFTVVGYVAANLNFPNTAAGACSNLNITVPGCVLSDLPILGAQVTALPANGAFTVYAGNGIVTVRYTNNDPAVAYDPPGAFFRVIVLRATP
jgi:hypothetical protein